ncbi:trehalose-phosphatase [Salinibacter altiplanensis]|uniref:trehalose-phosphatase n=1 Tax=Salinibacter altiplanensis TaxID=1803181 RepID=UPI001F462813|nr:trehalose-phosphatase [Salinibacter altiplanensis]
MSPPCGPMLPVVENPLFFLDYDGTLAPIVDDPDAAVPHPEAPALLRLLDARFPLWIVTGRDLQALSSFLNQSLHAIGLHGAQEGIVGRDAHSLMPDAAAEALRRLCEAVPDVEGLQVEDKDQSFAVHYRKAADTDAAQAQLKDWLADLPDGLDAIWGKQVVELRPDGLTKGTAVRRIAGQHPDRVPVYLGDDVTDEDAFAALQEMDRDVCTIKVGGGDTQADARLDGPDAVMAYLRRYG